MSSFEFNLFVAMVQATHPFKQVILTILTAILIIGCQGPSRPTPSLSSPDCRPVVHDLGESCIPVNPQRVVAIGTLEELLALDLKPIGAAFWVAGGGVGAIPSYLENQGNGIENLGNTAQPNLEKIIELQPDLIVGVPSGTEPIYEQLSRIAPTVVLDGEDNQWKEFLVRIADVLNRSEQADALLSNYQQQIEVFRQQMGADEVLPKENRLQQTKISVIRSFSNGMRIYMRGSFNGSVIEDTGLPRPPTQDRDKWFEDISLEAISSMDGDVIFVTHDNPADSYLSSVQSNPLWERLNAVQQERVYTVDHEYWIGGSSIIAANRVLDDLFTYLIPLGQSMEP